MKRINLFLLASLCLATHLFSQNTITGYRYWVDNNISGTVVVNVTATATYNLNASISPGSVKTGLHTFNVQFKDNKGKWSQPVIQYFMNFPSVNISGYEYWLDSNYASKTSQRITPLNTETLAANLAIPKLSPGLHEFYMRFIDNQGLWSEVQSQSVMVDNKGNVIVGYRTWLDNKVGFTAYHAFPVAALKDSLKSLLSVVQADSGKHVLRVQFKDKAGEWSSIVSDSFVKHTRWGIGTITPDSASDYSQDTISIDGNGFTDSTKVSLAMTGQTDIVPKYFKKVSANRLLVYFDLNGNILNDIHINITNINIVNIYS